MGVDLWRVLVISDGFFFSSNDSESWRTVDKEIKTISYRMGGLLGCLISC